ncbi:hypothetical protein BDV98DRAFT_567863 [Pterulicium gracile]|uniref:Secreted protein n=1 Tax=Pterulicium gracile TaxID=1884261 RepID=A0A5C3QSF7_9AGAR|nr:hypothetical protein BDV98DRAFT_567863 [Pterula gracilis]
MCELLLAYLSTSPIILVLSFRTCFGVSSPQPITSTDSASTWNHPIVTVSSPRISPLMDALHFTVANSKDGS